MKHYISPKENEREEKSIRKLHSYILYLNLLLLLLLHTIKWIDGSPFGLRFSLSSTCLGLLEICRAQSAESQPAGVFQMNGKFYSKTQKSSILYNVLQDDINQIVSGSMHCGWDTWCSFSRFRFPLITIINCLVNRMFRF